MCIEPPRPCETPVLAAEQLGHDPVGVGAARERVAVRAVGGDQVVLVAHRADGADDRRLLADREVQEAADLRLRVHLARALLEAADEHHRLEPLARGVARRAARAARTLPRSRRPFDSDVSALTLVHGPPVPVGRLASAHLRPRHLDRLRPRVLALCPPERWAEWAPHVRGAWGLGAPEVRDGALGAARLFGALPVPARIVGKRAGPVVDVAGRAWSRWSTASSRAGARAATGRDRRHRSRAARAAVLAAAYGPVIAATLRRLARGSALSCPRPAS